MKIRPLYDRVVIEPEEKEQTESGLFLPEGSKDKSQIGTVIEAGPGVWEDGEYIPMVVMTGDKVLFSKYSGTEIKMDGKKLLIIKEGDILAVLD